MIDSLVSSGFLDPLTARKVFAAIDEASLVRRRGKPSKCTEKNMPYHAVATPAEGPAQSITRDRVATIMLLSLLKNPIIPATEDSR
jgi:hypothetical protein